MPYARRKEFFGSLRLRLTAWNTFVVFIFITIMLVGVREGIRWEFTQEADVQLKEDAREIANTIERANANLEIIGVELDAKAAIHTHRGLYIRIFDEKNKLIYSTSTAPSAQLPTDLFRHGEDPVSYGQFRLVHTRIQTSRLPQWTIRVGVSYEPLENDIQQVSRPLLLAGIVTFLLSPIGGYWLAGRATRPIAHIIDTTNRLHPTSLNERLELRGTRDELDRLSETINGFLDRIAKYLEQNREFTSNAAHELRSPLAAIQNSLEVALNADRTPEEYREILAETLDECEALRTLVNQLLLLAENDSESLVQLAEPFDLCQIVRKAFDMFSGVAEAASIDLRFENHGFFRVKGDPRRMRQVINNLIDNAVKFTRSGGFVSINLSRDARRREIRLAISDTGSGIPAHDVPHIFDRFYRGDKARQRDRRSRGTGLGLAICQSIISAHAGRIEVESVVDQGTTMTVVLPELVGDTKPELPSNSAGSDLPR